MPVKRDKVVVVETLIGGKRVSLYEYEAKIDGIPFNGGCGARSGQSKIPRDTLLYTFHPKTVPRKSIAMHTVCK